MTSRTARRRSSSHAASQTATGFPALRGFFRGYLHEDFGEVHGSPVGAMDAFLADASPREVLALAREWARFSALIDGMPVARVRTILRDRFGCGWLVPRVADLRAVFRKLEPPRPQP